MYKRGVQAWLAALALTVSEHGHSIQGRAFRLTEQSCRFPPGTE